MNKPIRLEDYGYTESGRRMGAGRAPSAKTLKTRRSVVNRVNQTLGWFNTYQIQKKTKLNHRDVMRALLWLEEIGIIERKNLVKRKPNEAGRPTIVWGLVEEE